MHPPRRPPRAGRIGRGPAWAPLRRRRAHDPCRRSEQLRGRIGRHRRTSPAGADPGPRAFVPRHYGEYLKSVLGQTVKEPVGTDDRRPVGAGGRGRAPKSDQRMPAGLVPSTPEIGPPRRSLRINPTSRPSVAMFSTNCVPLGAAKVAQYVTTSRQPPDRPTLLPRAQRSLLPSRSQARRGGWRRGRPYYQGH